MKRLEYLDKLKGISIILVVFCHYTLLSDKTILGNIIMLIAWGAVPCFFISSGVVMHSATEIKWNKYFVRLLRTYIVLCVWKIIYLLVAMKYMQISFSKMQLVNYTFFFGNIENVKTDVLWFMNAYILVILFYPISFSLFQQYEKDKKIILFVLFTLFISGILVNTGNLCSDILSGFLGISKVNLVFLEQLSPFGNYKNMLFYFILGGILGKESIRIQNVINKNRKTRFIPYIVFVAGIISLLLLKYYQTKSFCWKRIYLDNGYAWCSTVILSIGLFLVIFCYTNEKKTSIWAFVGKNTMGIYYLHYPLLGYLSSCYIWKNLIKYNSCILNIIKTIIIVGICLIVTLLVKRNRVLKYLVG